MSIIFLQARDRPGNPMKPLETGQSLKAIKMINVFLREDDQGDHAFFDRVPPLSEDVQ
ncbi:MAG: hypothetical protein AB1405_04650 [Bdellovibrionota bacterium]